MMVKINFDTCFYTKSVGLKKSIFLLIESNKMLLM